MFIKVRYNEIVEFFDFFKKPSTTMIVFVFVFLFNCSANGISTWPQDSLYSTHTIKIALVMPFEVSRNSEVDPDNPDGPWIHPFSMPALHFYEGARLAIDSLARNGINASTTCFETPVDSSSMKRLLAAIARDSFDLLIANIPDKLIQLAVDRTGDLGIKLILTQALSSAPIKGKSNCALAYASAATQCSLVVDRFLKKYPDANFVILKGKSPREKDAAEAFRAAVHTLTSKKSTAKIIDLSTANASSASSLLADERQNIILFVSSDEQVVNPGLTSLAKSSPSNTVICGMPTWMNFESIDFMSFDRIQISLFDNNYIDLLDPNRIKFRKRFVNAYFDDPLSSAYAGFDLLTYLVPMVNNKPNAKLKELFTGSKRNENRVFEFKSLPEGGFENHKITLTYLEDYRFVDFENMEE
ncbi:MAG: hypothetical protein ACU4F9_01610 [Arcticibacter sp.]